jgi:hypothetical protein
MDRVPAVSQSPMVGDFLLPVSELADRGDEVFASPDQDLSVESHALYRPKAASKVARWRVMWSMFRR